jgi:hypothetical protein
MIGEAINPGEKVLINLTKEAKEWGYGPAPDGTEVTLVGFGEINYGYANRFGYAPGVYENRSWANVLLPDGREEHISTCYLKPVNEEEYNKRLAALRVDGSIPWNEKRLRDLPETRFWEDDLVYSPSFFDWLEFENHLARIAKVEYDYIGKTRVDGSPMPMYGVSNKWPSGWITWLGNWETWELVERGKVWKFWHNEPIAWANDEEHAQFLVTIGQTDEIRNPKDNLYHWTKDEAVQALRDGIGQVISVGNGFFGTSPRIVVRKLRDAELGEKSGRLL